MFTGTELLKIDPHMVTNIHREKANNNMKKLMCYTEDIKYQDTFQRLQVCEYI